MICAVVICALLAGGGPRECSREPGSTTIVDREKVPPDLKSCAAEFQRIRAEVPLPAGLRLVQFAIISKNTQTAEEPAR